MIDDASNSLLGRIARIGQRALESASSHEFSDPLPANTGPLAGRRTTLFFALLISVAFLFAFASLHWGDVFWTVKRSRPHSLMLLAAGLISGVVAVALLGLDRRVAPPSRIHWAILLTAIGVMAVVTALWALDAFPNSADEYAYLFEARTFEAGRLWNRPLPLGQVMGAQYIWVAQGKWAAQYPPAWPAVLAVADRIAPGGWLANVMLTLLATVGVGFAATRRAGQEAGWLAALLFGLSPFTIFNAGSLFSHTLAATLSVATMLAWTQARVRASLLWATAAGAALGALMLTRNTAAAAMAAALALGLIVEPKRIRIALGLVIGAVPFAVILLAYQYALTGDPLKPVYWLGGRQVDHLYFTAWGFKQGLRHNIIYFGELSVWVAPPITILWAIAIVVHLRHRTLSIFDLIFPFGVLLFCFYPLHPGNRYGPRYFFDFWPFLAITICSALPVLAARFRPVWRQTVRFSIVWGAALWLPLACELRWLIQDREEIYHAVAARHLSHAIVCIEEKSGHFLPMSENDVARNDIDGRNDVLYARCPDPYYTLPSRKERPPELGPESPSEHMTASPSQVAAAYPDRALWIFRSSSSPSGHVLVPVR